MKKYEDKPNMKEIKEAALKLKKELNDFYVIKKADTHERVHEESPYIQLDLIIELHAEVPNPKQSKNPKHTDSFKKAIEDQERVEKKFMKKQKEN